MTDEELMDLVKDGQLKHLGTLFERYHKRIYTYFVKITRDGSRSEDLTQHVFERIIQYRHTFGNQSSFQGWIFRIAKNSLMDHYRRRQPIDGNVSAESLDIAEKDHSGELDALAENTRRLRQALETLKPEYREVLVLTRYENLTYEEAGPVLGLSESAIKARVHRAMKSLKRAFMDIKITG